MSILKDVLSDEYDRLKSLAQWYKQEIALLPKGGISLKKRNGKDYLYINYRQKNKVKSDYVGLASSEKAVAMADKIKKRKKYESELKLLKNDLKSIERALHGKKI